MTVYDYIGNMVGGDRVAVIIDNIDKELDDCRLYYDSAEYLWTSDDHADLLGHRVHSVGVSSPNDPTSMIVTETGTPCQFTIRLAVQQPTIFSKMSYKIKSVRFELNKLRRNQIYKQMLFTRLFIDKYYLPEDALERWATHIIQDDNILLPSVYGSRSDAGYVLLYNGDVRKKYCIGRYHEPIFRIVVSKDVNGDIDTLRGPLGQKFLDYVDFTMPFTLEPNPRPLTPYHKVKRRLKGNIISEERLEELVQFVRDNYALFRETWGCHPSKFNSPKDGLDQSLIKPIVRDK